MTKAKVKPRLGRPTKRYDPEVIRKIEEVAALDGSVGEMAHYAGINPDTLYSWLKDDKALSERIAALRARPVLKARTKAIADMDNYWKAMDYLKRKRKGEFGDNIAVDGMNFSPTIVMYGDDDHLKKVMEKRAKK